MGRHDASSFDQIIKSVFTFAIVILVAIDVGAILNKKFAGVIILVTTTHVTVSLEVVPIPIFRSVLPVR